MKALDKEILRLALPSILANITVPLVGLVDTAVAGHLHDAAGSSAEFIGGISVGALILSVIYWNFAFLRASTGGLTAQAYGRGGSSHPASELRSLRSLRPLPSQATGPSPCAENGVPENLPIFGVHFPGVDRSSAGCALPPPSECNLILLRGLKLALGFAVLMVVAGWPLSRLSLIFRSATPGVAALAAQYILIRIWAAPATLCLMVFKGWFIGMQDTRSSMFTDLTVNIINIAASIILTLGIGNWPGLGFPGIALGTVIAQWSGLLLAYFICFRKYGILCSGKRPDFGTNTSKTEGLFRKSGSFLRLNTDLFVRSLCMTGIYFGYTIIASRYGETMLACANIMMNLLMLFSYFTDGFAYAGEALTGRFIGESNQEMLRRSVQGTFRWSFGVAGIWVLIYWLAGAPMLHWMTDDAVVVDACRQFLPWLLVMPLVGCAAFTWDGIFIGATASKGIRNSMIAALATFFAVWFAGQALLSAFAGITATTSVISSVAAGIAPAPAIHLLMAAYFAHLLARTVCLSGRYKTNVLNNRQEI